MTGLISSFFWSLVKLWIGWSPSHFGIFTTNKEEGVSQISLRILPKNAQTRRWARTKHYYTMPILLCFSEVFLHFWNVFVSYVWEINNCTAWVKPVFWNHSKAVLNFIMTLWRTAETHETHYIVLTSRRCLYDVAWL